jgi:uncharacterized repeat protein (TIGR03803 family)
MGSRLGGLSAYAFSGILAVVVPALSGTAHAKGFEVLYSFCSQQNCTDGFWPYAGLLTDKQGNYYGTTGAGGIPTCRLYGCGTVFKLAPDGTETVLHAFSAEYDGSGPYGGLIADSSGNLFGTTATGGSEGCGGIDYGCGTVFKISAKGKESIVYAFGGNADGADPSAGLVADTKGNFYGVTEFGGGGTQCIVAQGGCGTIFKLTPGGKETVLYGFSGSTDGADPQAALIIDEKGNLFGTATAGGNTNECSENESPGCGVVFEHSASGSQSVLYTFQGGNDGWSPVASLIEDKKGNLYGTTQAGGSTTACNGVGCGIIFRIAPNGTETVLYDFTGGSDGAHPAAGVIADDKGNLYGTTQSGGADDEGTVFKLTPKGKLVVLNAFNGQGNAPVANLIAGRKNTLVGTTEFGASGTIFRVKK